MFYQLFRIVKFVVKERIILFYISSISFQDNKNGSCAITCIPIFHLHDFPEFY